MSGAHYMQDWEAVDDVCGAPLDPKKVVNARGDKLELSRHMG